MLSVVIPIYNEEGSLAILHEQLSQVAIEHQYDLQIIMVDDGSSDASWEVIERLSEQDSRVQGIRFRTNFGKAAALSAGFRAVTGDFVMTLDGDLQDDPAEIPNFLDKLESEQVDVVSGWKKLRHDPWHKVGPSRIFNALVSGLTGVRLHDHNCGMKCYRAQVIREVNLYGELHRFVPVLASARGFKVDEIVVQHRPREHGKSKYGLDRFIKGFLDLLTVKFLTGFNDRPQHLLGGIGLVSFMAGFLGMFWLASYWVVSRIDAFGFDPIHLHERAALYYSLGFLLLGGQFMSIGFLGELITSHLSDESKSYSVTDTVGQPKVIDQPAAP